ncbi:MAG: hypothetical protein M3323_06715 [Actinomycetota bacterium]|nr:hypothetical protein [Actinomycetota bacterium]
MEMSTITRSPTVSIVAMWKSFVHQAWVWRGFDFSQSQNPVSIVGS